MTFGLIFDHNRLWVATASKRSNISEIYDKRHSAGDCFISCQNSNTVWFIWLRNREAWRAYPFNL